MTVHLVGAGPGDPDLITVRGARLLADAQVVLCDRLARPLGDLVAERTLVVDVGKAPGAAPVSQDEINRLLVDYGRRFDCVVRLKGGDPYVFARGAEEAAALAEAGVAYTVVPGISSVLAAPAAAGVPLTRRGMGVNFTVLSGHEDPAQWPPGRARSLVEMDGTIVVLMGAARIAGIAACLIGAGMDPATPVVASHAATTDQARVHRCTLGAIGHESVGSPAVFVIGRVAASDLRWQCADGTGTD